jgi:hypothetical protein
MMEWQQVPLAVANIDIATAAEVAIIQLLANERPR